MISPQTANNGIRPLFKGTRTETHDDFERVPGLPYSHDERVAAIQRAEEDYVAGRFVTSDVLKAKHPRI
jgi:hypothetical protein